jgi:2'-5' RNA ligase
MKIFAVYVNVELTKKPDWLDEFRKKYDQPYDFHVTLKQPCFINEEKVSQLKELVGMFFNKPKVAEGKLRLVFDEVKVDKSENGHSIMLKAKQGESLATIQKDLCATLANYSNYVDARTEAFEKHFEPHITIARNLSDDPFKEAMRYLKGEIECKGEIQEAVLSVVNKISPEEAMNPLNQTRYKL